MKIEFVSYDGKYPNLCSGTLILKVDGKNMKFDVHNAFWSSGGTCGFTDNYKEEVLTKGEWIVDPHYMPEFLLPHAKEIMDILNDNIPFGCCGGCL